MNPIFLPSFLFYVSLSFFLGERDKNLLVVLPQWESLPSTSESLSVSEEQAADKNTQEPDLENEEEEPA